MRAETGSGRRTIEKKWIQESKQETKKAIAKLSEEELWFKSALLDSATDSFFVRDLKGKLLYVNEAAYKTRGYTREELMAMPLEKLRSAPCCESVDSLVARIERNGGTAIYETEHVKKDGSIMPVEVSARIIEFGDKKVIASVVRDITERKKAEGALRQSEEKYRTLFLTMAQGALYRSADGTLISVNPAAERIFGMTFEEMKSKPLNDPVWTAMREDGSEMPGEMYPSMIALKTGKVVRDAVMRIYNRKEGKFRWISVNAIPQFRPGEKKPYQVYTTFDDITDLKIAEEQLKHLATHDPLTDLPNRRSVAEALKRAVARARRARTSAILFLDVDNFKMVNDTLGHAAGDHVLISLTQLIRKNLREEDMLARLGGDEFAVLMEDVTIEDAMSVADRMRRAVEKFSFDIEGRKFDLSLSIGLVPIDGDQDPWALLSKADSAMYSAKESGGNRIVIHDR